VPFGIIGVLFQRDFGPVWGQSAASSAGSVSFSFIHTNDMPLFWNLAVSHPLEMI
jgi:hypothetical protein